MTEMFVYAVRCPSSDCKLKIFTTKKMAISEASKHEKELGDAWIEKILVTSSTQKQEKAK